MEFHQIKVGEKTQENDKFVKLHAVHLHTDSSERRSCGWENQIKTREMESSAAAAAANAMLGFSSSTQQQRTRKSSLTLSTVLSTVMDVVVFLSVSVGYIVQVRISVTYSPLHPDSGDATTTGQVKQTWILFFGLGEYYQYLLTEFL